MRNFHLPNRLSAPLQTQITNASGSLQNQNFSLPPPFLPLSNNSDIDHRHAFHQQPSKRHRPTRHSITKQL
jgi:hypothetical protein